jgi:5-methylcytosine-specific restriction endonuclease McrA
MAFVKGNRPWNAGKTGTPGRPKSGASQLCTRCGKTYYVQKSYPGISKFCSMNCYHLGRWGGVRTITRPCDTCGKTFKTFAARQYRYCSRKCGNIGRSKSLRGSKCHMWRGGATEPYGPEWQKIRKQALRRDGKKCTICGSTKRPNVHHKNPHRYSLDHSLKNLITLCRRCHSREELKVNPESRKGLARRWPSPSAPAQC